MTCSVQVQEYELGGGNKRRWCPIALDYFMDSVALQVLDLREHLMNSKYVYHDREKEKEWEERDRLREKEREIRARVRLSPDKKSMSVMKSLMSDSTEDKPPTMGQDRPSKAVTFKRDELQLMSAAVTTVQV